MKQRVIKINGMHCKHCKLAIERNVGDIDGVKSIEVSLKNNTAIIEYEDILPFDKIKKAVEESGYSVSS